MAEDTKWYKNTGVIITLALAITPVIISQIFGVYVDIINSPTDFRVSLDKVSMETTGALTEAPSAPGAIPLMVISNESRIKVENCHRINPYEYEIFLMVVEEPPGINITFDPNALKLPDNDSSMITAKVSSDASSGGHPIEIEAVGGDGTRHRCCCIITVVKSYEINRKGEKSYRTNVEIGAGEMSPTDVGDVNASSTSEVSPDRDYRPSGDVRGVGAAPEGKISRPTGEVR